MASSQTDTVQLPIPGVQLNSGYKIPLLGLGTWQLADGEVEKAVGNAIELGYRHFDCAPVYFNEEAIGKAIKKKVEEGLIERQDIFLTTKLPVFMNDPQRVREAINTSLTKLNTDYVDLYLIHLPISIKETEFFKLGPAELMSKPKDPSTFFKNVDPLLVWKEMEKLVDDGLVKSIGLSNFSEEQIEHIVKNCGIKPSVLEVECHPYFPQEKLLLFCRKNDIVMAAYAPLGSPQRWGGSGNDNSANLLDEPILCKIGEKHAKTPAQIVLRWLVQRNIAAIPKTIKKERLQENSQIWNFKLSDQEMQQIAGLAKSDGRRFGFEMWSDSPNYPFKAYF